MCLYTYDREPSIAKEDIICYKVLVKTKIPFVYKTPIIGEELIKIPFLRKSFKAIGYWGIMGFPTSYGVVYEVSSGFIHTYADIEEAISRLDYIIECKGNSIVFKCVIPKGTKYFKSDSSSEYASEEIIIVNRFAYEKGKV